MIWNDLDETEHYDSYCHCVRDMVEKLNIRSMVEVGVWEGRLSRFILAEHHLTYYMVDPWRVPPEEARYRGVMGRQPQGAWDALYERVEAEFGPMPNVSIMRQLSVEAATMFPDDSVDLVFIDANHSYESVQEDIVAWIPKARYITGHDYGLGEFKGVRKAVDEIFPLVHHGRPPHRWGFVWAVDKREPLDVTAAMDKLGKRVDKQGQWMDRFNRRLARLEKRMEKK